MATPGATRATGPIPCGPGDRPPQRSVPGLTGTALLALLGLGAVACAAGPSAPTHGPVASTAAVQVSPPPATTGGASGPSRPPGGLSEELAGHAWQLTAFLAGGDVTEVIEGHEPTISFSGDTVAGNGGCNSFSGAVEAEAPTAGAGRIAVTGIAVTQMACVETVLNEQETRFLEQLGRVARYRLVAGRSLVLEDASGQVGLRFTDAAAPP